MSESQQLLHEHDASFSDSDPETAFSSRRLSPAAAPEASQASRSHSVSPVTLPGQQKGDANGKPTHTHGKRQSSFYHPRPDGTPRTPNRVRFQEEPVQIAGNGQAHGAEWIELEGDDYMDNHHLDGAESRERVQRLPLLTGIEAPSVALATELDFDPEDHLESARPRSGMRSAFMNMANSIM